MYVDMCIKVGISSTNLIIWVIWRLKYKTLTYIFPVNKLKTADVQSTL